jgi:outer membrane protein assembly factor BamE (lipoprotein component of BamABCDE complex)
MLRPTTALRQLTLAAAVAGLLAGCALPDFLSFPPQVRGNKVDEEQLAQLVPGTSTRQDATAAIGSPTARATFDDNTWIYITETTRPIIGGFQGVEAQQVYVLTFDTKGVLGKIEKKTMQDALPVDVVARTTPSPGTEASWLQQLLGNVGRFSPISNPGGVAGAPGTAQSPNNF